jgi:predicted Fe-Mo cluster-binding NifX family protein
MRIAIPIIDNKGLESIISEHFGHAPYFAFVVTENREIVSHEIEANPFEDHQPGQIPEYVKSRGANVIITRGMGGRAKQFFDSLGVQAFTGADGIVREIVEAYLKDSLQSKDYEPLDRGQHHHG